MTEYEYDKKNHPFLHGVLEAEDYGKKKAIATIDAVAKGVGDTAETAALGTAKVAVAAARKSGNTGLNMANTILGAKDVLQNTADNTRNRWNSMGNFTGTRSHYQFKNGLDKLEVNATVSIDDDHYIKVDMTDESKEKMHDALEKYQRKTEKTKRFGLWGKGGTSHKMKKTISRRKTSHRKKSRRRPRL